MTRDGIVLWTLLTAVILLLTYTTGYTNGKESVVIREVPVYLTGTVDPLLCLKGKRT